MHTVEILKNMEKHQEGKKNKTLIQYTYFIFFWVCVYLPE